MIKRQKWGNKEDPGDWQELRAKKKTRRGENEGEIDRLSNFWTAHVQKLGCRKYKVEHGRTWILR